MSEKQNTEAPVSEKQSTELRPEGLETKDLAAAMALAPPSVGERLDEVEVEMIHHYTYEGRNLNPGEVVSLPGGVAYPLIAGSFAKRT